MDWAVLTEAQLQSFQLVLDQARDGVIVFSGDGVIEQFNEMACDTFGFGMDEVIGRNITALVDFAPADLSAPFSDGSQELTGVRKDGTTFPLEVRVGKITVPEAVYFAVTRDITERKKKEEKIINLARQDGLTGLPNRALMVDRLRQAISNCRRHENRAALVFIDLDHFKIINDTQGHDVGDEVLKEIAVRLKTCVRESDTIARFGGDEFVALLIDLDEAKNAGIVAERMRVACKQPVVVDGASYDLSASIGIAVYPDDGGDGQALMRHADTAMYHAKAAGKNNFQFFSPDMNQRALDRLSMERRLRTALQKNEFQLYYQPQVDMSSGQIVGAEALIRWISDGTVISPADFIPVAEETGLIVPIGEWVLRAACEQNQYWQQMDLPRIKVAVNLSARQFNKNLPGLIGEVLCEAKLSPADLEMEITESLLMKDVDAAISIMGKIDEMGVDLSIDDFGTGYSSLGHLKRFPVKSIKIDRTFVRDLPGDEDDRAITSAIIAMAKHLRLHSVGEGVETDAQREFLRGLGCNSYQGYFFSKPVPAGEFARILSANGGFTRFKKGGNASC